MSNFSSFAKKVEARFTEIQAHGKLFKSSIEGDELWETYISSFNKGDNPVFRDPESSSHNCNLDKSFIRRYGNVVAIDSSFNIVKEIYLTKKREIDAEKNAASIKEYNQKIMQLIHEKQEGALKDKSIEELQEMLKQ